MCYIRVEGDGHLFGVTDAASSSAGSHRKTTCNMSVQIRQKISRTDGHRYNLDIWNDGRRHYEFLKLYQIERQQGSERKIFQLAEEEMRARRELKMQE